MKISRKNYLNTTVSGRSLLEMLGVIAIMGVLTAGGIKGFQYALNRHAANQHLNDAITAYTKVMHMRKLPNKSGIKRLPLKTATGKQLQYYGATGYAYVVMPTVEAGVCKQLLEMKPSNLKGIVDTNDTAITAQGCESNPDLYFKFALQTIVTPDAGEETGGSEDTDGTTTNECATAPSCGLNECCRYLNTKNSCGYYQVQTGSTETRYYLNDVGCIESRSVCEFDRFYAGETTNQSALTETCNTHCDNNAQCCTEITNCQTYADNCSCNTCESGYDLENGECIINPCANVTCSGCQTCVEGNCTDNDASCEGEQTCENGVCRCASGGTYNETAGMCCDEVTAGVCQTVTEATSGVCPSVTTAQDGTECTTASNEAGTCLSGVCQVDYEGKDCTSNDHCGGDGNGTYFCAFDNPTDCGDDDKGAGKCALVSRYSYDETTDGDWRLTAGYMNWWNAQNWCYAQSGFRPATREDVECTGGTSYAGCLTTSTIVRGYNSSERSFVTTYTDASGNTQTRLFAQEGGVFTSDYAWLEDRGNSCYAYGVGLNYGAVVNGNGRNTHLGYTYSALCVRR